MGIIMGTGANDVILNLNAHTVTDLKAGEAEVAISFNTNGQISYTGNIPPSPNPDTDEWVQDQTGFSEGASYEVAYTVLVSGTGPGGDDPGLGDYQALGTVNRQWDLSATSDTSGVWRFRVREIADTSNFVEADMTMVCSIIEI